MPDDTQPYIPASRSLAELTVRAIVLGLILSVVMCAANIYVGLYAGMTVSAAIPACVISMGVLRGLFRAGTILENSVCAVPGRRSRASRPTTASSSSRDWARTSG